MTIDPSQDAAAFLRFAIDPDPDAIPGEVLARYEDADDLRQLLSVIAVILSAAVVTPSEIASLLRARLDAMALLFMGGQT